MRVSVLTFLAALTSAVHGRTIFADFPKEVRIGETYNVVWMADKRETLELTLLSDVDETFTKTLFCGIDGETPGGRWAWEIDSSLAPGEKYRLFLNGEPIQWLPWRINGGDTDLTDDFTILAPDEESKDHKNSASRGNMGRFHLPYAEKALKELRA